MTAMVVRPGSVTHTLRLTQPSPDGLSLRMRWIPSQKAAGWVLQTHEHVVIGIVLSDWPYNRLSAFVHMDVFDNHFLLALPGH
jgi:hypothetical protein